MVLKIVAVPETDASLIAIHMCDPLFQQEDACQRGEERALIASSRPRQRRRS